MPKGVIVLLVVIGVLFALTLVVGHSKHGQSFHQGDDPPGIVKAFKGGGSPLTISGNVTTNCAVISSTQVSTAGTCSIDVPSRSAFSSPKRVALAAAGGTTAVLIVPVDRDPEGPKTIPTDRACLSSAIDHKGGRIQLTCGGGGTCTVTLARSCG